MNNLVATAFAQVIVLALHDGDSSLSRWLHRAVARGDVVRLVRGVFIPRAALEPLQSWHVELLRVYAAGAWGRIRQPLCGASAARVWGVPLLGNEQAVVVDALGWHNRATRRVSDVQYWATADDRAHVVERHGIALTDLPRTLAELGVRSSFERTVAAIDWAIRVRRQAGEPATTVDDIRAVAESLALVRGRVRLERALAFADGRAESPGESWARVLIHELGFEVPDLQHEYQLLDGQVFRTDFRWASIRLAGEFDGLVKYRATEMRGGRTAEQVVIEEKEREDAVRATGDGVLRCVWADLRDPNRLTQLLESAGVPRRVRRRHVTQ